MVFGKRPRSYYASNRIVDTKILQRDVGIKAELRIVHVGSGRHGLDSLKLS